LATFLGEREFSLGTENFYALILRAPGSRTHGGVLRVGLVHYNTSEEVDRLLSALGEFSSV